MSKWGEGIGTSVVVCKNPNKPSVDPAEKHGAASKKIEWLCSAKQWKKLNDWERKFIQDIYGTANLSRRQKMRLWVICDRVSSNPSHHAPPLGGGSVHGVVGILNFEKMKT